MVNQARKIAKRLGAKLRKKEVEESKTLRLFALGSIMNHIKTNWVEIKRNVITKEGGFAR